MSSSKNKCVVVISQQGAPSVIVTCERPGPNITYPGSGSGSGGGAGAGMLTLAEHFANEFLSPRGDFH